jgi:hypothetical protein
MANSWRCRMSFCSAIGCRPKARQPHERRDGFGTCQAGAAPARGASP